MFINRALFRQIGEPGSVDALNHTGAVSIEHLAGRAREIESRNAFKILQVPDHTVDGASRQTYRRLIHSDNDKPVVHQLPRGRDRPFVGVPPGQKLSHVIIERPDLFLC